MKYIERDRLSVTFIVIISTNIYNAKDNIYGCKSSASSSDTPYTMSRKKTIPPTRDSNLHYA